MTESVLFEATTPTSIGPRVGITFLFAISGLTVVGALASALAQQQLPVSLVVLFVLVALMMLATWRSGVFVKVTHRGLRLGLFPVWRTSIPYAQIASVDTIRVAAFEDYRGWGIKGSARSPRGRLYSVGGSLALRVRTVDQRSYLASFPDGSGAPAAIVSFLEQRVAG